MKIEIVANKLFNGKRNRVDPFRAEINGECLAIGRTKTEVMDKAIETMYGYYQQRCATIYCATVPVNGCVIIGHEYYPGNEDIHHFYPNADGTMRSGGICSGLIGQRSMRDSFDAHVKSYVQAVTPISAMKASA
jgi:hypothetical protein